MAERNDAAAHAAGNAADDVQADERELSAAERVINQAKAYGELVGPAHAEVERRRLQAALLGMIGSTGWGRKELDDAGRRALAAYCLRYGVDPLTELDWLDGPYVNAEYYKRKMGELVARGRVKSYELHHVHLDPRNRALMDDESAPDEFRQEARVAWYWSQRMRAKYNIPENAAAAVVCMAWLPDVPTPIVGVRWAGNGTSTPQFKQGGAKMPNPVLEANPQLSAESQSIRRCVIQIEPHNADLLPPLDVMEAEGRALVETMAPRKAAEDARNAAAARPAPPMLQPGDYYGSGSALQQALDAKLAQAEPAELVNPSVVARAARAAAMDDPYTAPARADAPDALDVLREAQAGDGTP